MLTPRAFTFLASGLMMMGACTPAATDTDANGALQRGMKIYAQDCAECHGSQGEGGGPASLGLGAAPPDLVGIGLRNGGPFPREFVRRFVLGQLEKDDPDAAMPEFSRTGFRHAYRAGTADADKVDADLSDLLVYLESIQRTE